MSGSSGLKSDSWAENLCVARPLCSFDLVKLPCSLKLVTTLTGISPGGKTGILCDKINGKLSCSLPYLLHFIISSHSCLWGWSFRTDDFPQATGQSGEVPARAVGCCFPASAGGISGSPLARKQDSKFQLLPWTSKPTLDWGRVKGRGCQMMISGGLAVTSAWVKCGVEYWVSPCSVMSRTG